MLLSGLLSHYPSLFVEPLMTYHGTLGFHEHSLKTTAHIMITLSKCEPEEEPSGGRVTRSPSARVCQEV